MSITWERRHESDPGLLAYEGRFIRGQVAMYGETDDRLQSTGRHYWIGYLAGRPVTERCDDVTDACRRVEAAFARI
jgi:hypothetical protein